MKKNIYFVFIPEEVQANVHAYEFPILEKIQETWGAGVDNKVVCIRPAKPNKVAEERLTINLRLLGVSKSMKIIDLDGSLGEEIFAHECEDDSNVFVDITNASLEVTMKIISVVNKIGSLFRNTKLEAIFII